MREWEWERASLILESSKWNEVQEKEQRKETIQTGHLQCMTLLGLLDGKGFLRKLSFWCGRTGKRRQRERERERERETSKQSTTPLRPATNNKMAYQPNGSSRLQCRSPQASTDHYDGTHGPFRSSMCFIKKCIYAMYCLDSCVPSKCEPV